MIALAKPQLNSIDEVIHGEALAVLRTLPDNSVDAIVCDPPAGIEFMGKEWDKYKQGRLQNYTKAPGGHITDTEVKFKDFKYLPNVANQRANAKCSNCGRYKWGHKTGDSGGGGKKCECDNPTFPVDNSTRETFISFLTLIMAEALRVLKPGGHAFVWALPRTSHWTGIALEDAGFEIRDVITHLFGSGFPKSHDISAAIDKMHGAEREVIGFKLHARDGDVSHQAWTIQDTNQNKSTYGEYPGFEKKMLETAPATPEASQWDGWGTALKPASEHWYLARKPLSEKSIAENVLKWGTGAINIEASRIGQQAYTQEQWNRKEQARTTGNTYGVHKPSLTEVPQGRWPANLLLSHSVWCVPNVDDWLCDESCPVRLLDEQSGMRKSGLLPSHQVHRTQKNTYGKPTQDNTGRVWGGDQGGASRYFQRFYYVSKASRAERNRGCEGLPYKTPGECTDRKDGSAGLNNPRAGAGRTAGGFNTHPTVKSIALMRYLVRMITPPGGIVLDCFAGSGSTLVAAVHEGMHFIGIEMNDSEQEPYVTIARARIEQAFREVQS